MIDRKQIITILAEATRAKDYVYAMWLEGSEPQGFADEYSDIDLWFSVDDDKVFGIYDEFESILETIAPIDFRYVVKHEGELGHIVYHLMGSSEFLTVDINTQGISREAVLTQGIDDATVIFDKMSVVQFKGRDSLTIDIETKRQKLRGFYSQMLPSVLKNIQRGKKLETLYYYHLILKYITKFLWLKYGISEKKDFDLKHLDRHIPQQDANSLEEFYDVRISEIELMLPRLKEWLYSL